MAEVTIKYKNKKTLEALKDLSKHLDFVVSAPDEVVPPTFKINGVTILKGDQSIDLTGLEKIFSNKKLSARDLRAKGWQRT
ncbi:hypothetical protein RT717_21715 [Imperialibacter roseus]|uniref:HMA domain-containing protein n=1 Tax=Imperialibacter roseus TaxID=1324217 RepID=A0ABZ0IMG1_9BACT|nr:hypothetical protein [Imperialibacter roseus]WOK05697.1 hypothetical protein RT717_21715 [Imperialibacter roseus]